MASLSRDASSQKAIEGDLTDTGKRLLAVPSSTDELVILLEKAESLLAKVGQRPPKSTRLAIFHPMKALMAEEILCHDDLNVQVAVASCFSEVSRISCSVPPYNFKLLKLFFKLVMVAFRQLSCESNQNYSKALHTIETIATVKASLLLLEIDADGLLIVEMFQIFLSTIMFNHPSNVSKYMEMIMTTVIEEGDEISFDLIKTLLDSVKMVNKNTSPASWELGKKVFENCATKLQSYLRKAVKEMDLDVTDYAEIVASIYHDTSDGENMVSEVIVTPSIEGGASELDGLYEAAHGSPDGQTTDGNGPFERVLMVYETKSNGKKSSETLKRSPSVVQSRASTIARRSKRCRKPNSVLRPEEGYQYVWTLKCKYSGEASSDDHCQEEKIINLEKKTGKRDIVEPSDTVLEKEGGILNDTRSDDESEMSLHEGRGRKEMTSTELEDIVHEVSNEVVTTPTISGRASSQLDGVPMAAHDCPDGQTNDGTNTVTRRSKRCRKPNSVLRPEEGYQYVWTLKGKNSGEASSDGHCKEVKNSNVEKRTDKRAIAESSDIGLEKEGGILNATRSDDECEMSPQIEHGRKEIISTECEDFAHEMEKIGMSKRAKSKHTMKDKEKVSKEVVITPTTSGGASQLDGLPMAAHGYPDAQTKYGTNAVARRSKRCKKPNSAIRPEEGYQYVRTLKRTYSGEPSSDGDCKDKDNSSLEKGYKTPKQTSKREIAESSDIRLQMEGGILIDISSDEKSEVSPQEQHGMREIISQECEDILHEIEEFPESKRAKGKHSMKDNDKVSKEVVTSSIGGGNGLPIAVHEYPDGQANDGTNNVARRSRRCRKPNSVLRPEEGYQYVWTLKCKFSGDASSDVLLGGK